MINRKPLLDDLKKLVTKLERDLRDRCEESADVDTGVRAEYERAKEAKRTAQAYTVWRDEWITQVAVAWVLGVVFVRFIEDNELIAAPFIAGPGERLQFAKEHRTAFFQQNPTLSDREYLEHVFRAVAKLPAMGELYDEHNPLWTLGVSGDGAKLILEQFQRMDPTTGTLVHDFTDAAWETRFLGDLYQELSENAQKKFALKQTPEFVEEFILDRTLDPAIAQFGLATVKLIDPTCGSGHFLLGAFARLFKLWEEREPATNLTVLAQRVLAALHGVDLNPYAIGISRFRLLVAALKVSALKRLADAPDFKMNLAIGDSLLHGSPGVGGATQAGWSFAPMAHIYETEDREQLERILQAGHYHAVVGNPPYVAVKDAALNQAYRARFASCHRQYSLAVPFTERFFSLAVAGAASQGLNAGFVGMITANSFMKREFGKKLIENFIPSWNLTHVIDTSGAYIPGHGTPTVILFGLNSPPVSATIRTVMGIKGEPTTPDDPAQGQVWRAILDQVDEVGSQSQFVSVTDSDRDGFHHHPWSIGGGGASELKTVLDSAARTLLGEKILEIGRTTHTGEDDVFYFPESAVHTYGLKQWSVPLVVGEDVRDYCLSCPTLTLFPYDKASADVLDTLPPSLAMYFWRYRTTLRNRQDFGEKIEARGLRWFEHSMFFPNRYRTPLSIAFAFVASHNHFVLDRGGKVFNRSAPVIKLPADATGDDHLALLGLLNSSSACFWMKQVSQQKQLTGGDGVRVEAIGKVPYEFSGTQLANLPLPSRFIGKLRERLVDLTRAIDTTGRAWTRLTATDAIEESVATKRPVREVWEEFASERARLLKLMVFLQEEIDFQCYVIYGLADESVLLGELPDAGIAAGERPFEILAGKNQEGFDVPQDIPRDWQSPVRDIWRKRMDAIDSSSELRVIESAHYKRRWIGRQGLFNRAKNVDEFRDACAGWMLTRLESPEYWHKVALQSVSRLAATMQHDSDFMIIAETHRGTRDFNIAALMRELVVTAAVAALPVDRYKESGLRKREAWEETWSRQRLEDAAELRSSLPIGEIPVPPKYKPADFRSATYWSLRKGLDVPKERFISFPGCEREADPSLPILWAGYDHLQQAKAIAAYYQDLKENEAAPPAKLGKLLACILELLPWLKQWHNDVDSEYGARMGDFFETFMQGEMAGLGLTMDDLRRIRGL